MLVLATPHMKPLAFIKESGLSDAAGFVNVDKHTTQHVTYPNIFSLGDSSSLPTSKTAAAIAAQSSITTQNLLSVVENKPLTAKYNGYTSCPLVTGRGKLIMAEFQGPGYGATPLETFYFDQAIERKSMYAVKANFLPSVYWGRMLKGKWDGMVLSKSFNSCVGPGRYRSLTNPFNKN